MAVVVFYEKPGCANNTRQKQWLRDSGHVVIEQNILNHNWSANELLKFFNKLPVEQWFNQSSPRIKYGKIVPGELSAEQAIALMQADPLLIRRPLMLVNNEEMVGFDSESVDRWIGLSSKQATRNLEVCTKQSSEAAKAAGLGGN